MSGEGPPTERPAASDAFQALGSATRTTVLESLTAEPKSFSTLHGATDEDTSAGFAYHLRQLDGQFVRQRPDGDYDLTFAGRAAARSVRAGIYTESVDRERVPLGEDCPHCGGALAASVTDNVAEIRCEACDERLLELPFPPSGYAERDTAGVPAALDAYHRRRIETFADGVCPDCGAPATAAVELAAGRDDGRAVIDGAAPAEDDEPILASFACETCGSGLRCPVALPVLDHPAVVAFYHDHGEDVRERPLWTVGAEWRETVISRDPLCVAVSTRLDDDELVLSVGRDGTVVDHRRTHHDDDDGASDPSVARVPSDDLSTDAIESDEFPRPDEGEMPADGATA
ncbi:MAG: ArsR family transcriptional regulator [Haloarculaceae archaeon]